MKYYKVQMQEVFTKTFIVKAKCEEDARDILDNRFNDEDLNCTDDIEDYDREILDCKSVSKKSVIGMVAIKEYDADSDTDAEIVR